MKPLFQNSKLTLSVSIFVSRIVLYFLSQNIGIDGLISTTKHRPTSPTILLILSMTLKS